MAQLVLIPKGYPKGRFFSSDLKAVQKILDEKMGQMSPEFAQLFRDTCPDCYQKVEEIVFQRITAETESRGIDKFCLTLILAHIFNHTKK